jgi:hypothetical protein
MGETEGFRSSKAPYYVSFTLTVILFYAEAPFWGFFRLWWISSG